MLDVQKKRLFNSRQTFRDTLEAVAAGKQHLVVFVYVSLSRCAGRWEVGIAQKSYPKVPIYTYPFAKQMKKKIAFVEYGIVREFRLQWDNNGEHISEKFDNRSQKRQEGSI